MNNIDPIDVIHTHASGYRHHWVYSEHDRPVMAVARYESSGKKTYRQFHLEEGKWVAGTAASPYPLFGLSSLSQISPLQAVFICEGEKCVETLHQLGWPAVTSILGARNTDNSDWLTLRHFNRFIILRDNDKGGISSARAVSAELHRIHPNPEVLAVNLMPDRPGADIVDWLQATVLCGQKWDGFTQIPESLLPTVQTALTETIPQLMVNVSECPDIAFQPVEPLFKGPPKELVTKLRDVAPFPVNALPANVQEFLETTSAQFSQTPDFAGTAFLAAISGLIGRSIRLKMRQGDEWYEVANSWAILVGRPSTKKSPILRRILGLFEELEAKAAEEFKKLKKAYKEKKREAAKNDEEFDEPEPKRRRYTTDDVTMPKLRELMAANPNGIILRNDELKGQLERLEKTGSEGDRSFMMNCWSGLEVYSEDRMCRDSHINIPLSLTWIGCIPPSPLQRYLREAMGRGSGADGFMQRFQLVCFPDVQKEFTLPTHTLSAETIDCVKELISEVDSGVRESQRTLSFSTEEAQKHFDEWLVKHENHARSGQHPIYWESHLGKQATALAVLTIVLHRLDECAQEHQTDIVSLHTLEQAQRLLHYYEAHARRCYDSVAGATVDDAKAIISLLREKRLPHRFKAQDIYGQGLGGLEDSRRVRTALELLEDKDWLVVEKVGSTGRKHEYWILNPCAFEN